MQYKWFKNQATSFISEIMIFTSLGNLLVKRSKAVVTREFYSQFNYRYKYILPKF